MSEGFYENLLTLHGDSPRALDWSAAGQHDRFKVLAEIGISHGDSVLDVGCGLAHFYRYLVTEHRFRGTYVGVDASKSMIEAARAPSLLHANALRDDLPAADYVVASGVLNLSTELNEEEMRTLLHKCFAACKVGAAVNMLSNLAPTKRADRHYYDPAWALDEALEITSRVTLRHDYRSNDFCLYLKRTT